MNYVSYLRYALLVALGLLLAACGARTATETPTPGLIRLTLTSGLSAQAIPFDESNAPVVTSLAVTVLDAGGESVSFNDDLVYDSEGGTTAITFALDESVTVALPANQTYTFKTQGFDADDVWMSYGETLKNVSTGSSSVQLELSTLIETASFATSAPVSAVLPGQLLDLYLQVSSPGGYAVPFADYSSSYTLGADDGSVDAQSGLGARVTAASSPLDDAFSASASVSGWTLVDGAAVSGSVAATFEAPFAIASGLTLDSEAPTLSVTVPGTLSAGVEATLSGSASDNVGLAKVQVFEGPVLIGSSDTTEFSEADVAQVSFSGDDWTMPWTPATGEYALKVVATDSSGNQSVNDTGVTARFVLQFGSSDTEVTEALALDANGNLYVGGYTYGSLEGQSSSGEEDAFVAKYAPDGSQLWTRQFGTNRTNELHDVATDASGNVYGVGVTENSFPGITGSGSYDAFIAKYDASGNQLWIAQLGSSAVDKAYGVATDAAGNVYVSGYTNGSLPGGSNLGSYDAFLTKYDTSGTQLWAEQFGSDGRDEAHEVATDAAGNIYVSGFTSGSFTGDSNAGGFDIFIAKYDASGSQLWVEQFGSDSGENVQGLATDASGNVLVSGRTSGTLPGNSMLGNQDAFVAKYAPDGAQLWVRQFGTGTIDYASGLATDAGDNVYVSGYTYGNLEGDGGDDAFIIKYAANGARTWVRQFGTSSGDNASDVAVTASGSVYVSGDTRGDLSGGGNAGSSDAFIVKYDSDGVAQ